MKLPYDQYAPLFHDDRHSKDEANEWVQANGSGSLKRALEECLVWEPMYVHERLAWEFGAGFDLYCPDPAWELKPVALPDDRATTETCWYARRLRAIYAERKMDVTIQVASTSDGGLGIRVVLGMFMVCATPFDRFLLSLRNVRAKAEIFAPVATRNADGTVEVSNPC